MDGRSRAFNAVFYPESAPANFREQIADWNVPALLILHDKDEDKKPHYHLLLMFAGKKSLRQVRELVVELGSNVVQPAYDVRGSARYLLHLDSPGKYRYPTEALEAFSGAPVLDLTAPVGDPSPEIMAFVREQGLTEYSKLIDYCLDQRQDWFPWARAHTMFLCGYFMSVRHHRGVDE